jgi:hypothetical protein
MSQNNLKCKVMNLFLEDLKGMGGQRSPMIMRFMSEDIGDEGDSTSFEEAISSVDSSKWLKAMEDEMRSMSTDQVCDLVEIPRRAKIVGCK